VEPIGEEEGITKEFVNAIVGSAVPPHLIPAVEKGYEHTDTHKCITPFLFLTTLADYNLFLSLSLDCSLVLRYEDILMCGPLLGFPVERVRMVINDGAFHSVDSTEIAFRICSHLAFKEGFKNANPSILEPIMKAEIIFPAEFQGGVIGIFTRRKGVIYESHTEGDTVTLTGEVPLNNMFGFSTELRSCTQGKGEFTLEYCRHQLVPREQLSQLMELYKDRRRGPTLA
jgi:translation elongation factor EF-G